MSIKVLTFLLLFCVANDPPFSFLILNLFIIIFCGIVFTETIWNFIPVELHEKWDYPRYDYQQRPMSCPVQIIRIIHNSCYSYYPISRITCLRTYQTLARYQV